MGRTNIDLDDALVKEGLELTHLKTKKELVHFALESLLKRARRKRILGLEGRVPWEGDLDEMRAPRT